MSDENPNIQVEITDASEFHCFKLVLNASASADIADPRQPIEILLHARSLVDLIHKCSLALCNWQAATSEELLRKMGVELPHFSSSNHATPLGRKPKTERKE